jgi:hypothetical protein
LIADFATRAFRRPLAQDEQDDLFAIFQLGRDTDDQRYPAGIGWVVRAVVQSPDFIYRTELGDPATSRLTAHERASAISYGVVAAPPDDALLAAAADGTLLDDAVAVTHARRLLQTPDASVQLRRFVAEWLHIDFTREAWRKNTAFFPSFTAAMVPALSDALDREVQDWAGGGASFDALMTSSDAFVDATIAPIYGVAAPAEMSKVTLDPSERAGVLTSPAFLGSHGNPNRGSPVLRGVTILQRVLCKSPPPPPPNIPPLSSDVVGETKTTRERFAAHSNNPACSSCHSRIDPLGFTLEHYDGLGAYRTQENGAPIDSSGAILGTDYSDATIADGVDLSRRLAASPDAHDCFSRQLASYMYGRAAGAYDQCSLDRAYDAFVASGRDTRALAASLVTSVAATARTITQETP